LTHIPHNSRLERLKNNVQSYNNIKAYGRFGVKVKELKSETNNAIANCLLNSILRIVF
jgi:hypothetical protein